MDNNEPNQEFELIRQPPLQCKIWRNPAVQMPDKPHWTPYTVGVCWRDGMVREGSFSIDEEKIAELEEANPATVNREGLLMHMIAQAVQEIFANREKARAAEKATKLILPERFR